MPQESPKIGIGLAKINPEGSFDSDTSDKPEKVRPEPINISTSNLINIQSKNAKQLVADIKTNHSFLLSFMLVL